MGCGAIGVGGGDVDVAATGCDVGVIVGGMDVGMGTVGVGVDVGVGINCAAATGVVFGNTATNTEEPANGVCIDFNASSSAIISARILSLSSGANASGACKL